MTFIFTYLFVVITLASYLFTLFGLYKLGEWIYNRLPYEGVPAALTAAISVAAFPITILTLLMKS